MSTYNRTVNQNTAGVYTALSANALNDGRTPALLEAVIDFSATGNVNLAADIFELIQIPAGYAILGSGIEVLVADTAGNSGTLTVKVGSTSQGSAATVAATGYTATVGTFTPVVPSGSSAFLNLVVGTGAINAVVRLFVLVQDTRFKPGTGVCTAAGVYASPSLSYTLTSIT